MSTPIQPAPGAPRHSLVRRWAALLVGAALLIASVILVFQQRDQLALAWNNLRNPDWRLIACLFAAIIAAQVLTGLLFSALMSKHGRVGLLEMQALLAFSTLVNFIPLRPGLLGRVAYHHAVNRISPLDSSKAVLAAVALSVSLSALLAGGVWITTRIGWPIWIALVIPLALPIIAAAAPSLRVFALPALLRWIEILLWAARALLAFELIGQPIEVSTALALACSTMIANLVPLAGNGLGVREWATGLLAPLLSPATLATAITAELVNRAAEIVAALVMGAIGAVYLARKRSSRLSPLGDRLGPPSA